MAMRFSGLSSTTSIFMVSSAGIPLIRPRGH
jgi:hypothetical protein